MTEDSAETPTAAPLLRVVKGDPTPAELAALVTVVSAMAGASAASTADTAPRPEWSARHRLQRTTLRHGPGAWRASAR